MNPVDTTISRLIKEETEDLNIFTCFADDQYFNYELSKIPRVWQYVFGGIPWKLSIDKPSNIQIVSQPPLFSPDLIISHDRTNQYALCKQLSDISHCPYIIVNHAGPNSLVNHPQFHSLKNRTGFTSVYTSQVIREKWEGVGYTHLNSADKSVFTSNKDRPKRVILLEPENPQQELLFKELSSTYECFVLDGKNEKELAHQFNQGRVFVNLNGPQVNFSTIQAMACGCATISAKSDEITAYIKHGENGFLCGTFGEISPIISSMMTDEFYRVTDKAREAIGDYKVFQDGWSNIISNSSKIMYER